MTFRPVPYTTFELDGIAVRVVSGRKESRVEGEQDLVVEWLTAVGWRPIRMRSVAWLSGFFFHNEEVLYPSVLGYQGGEKWMERQRAAIESSVDSVSWSI